MEEKKWAIDKKFVIA